MCCPEPLFLEALGSQSLLAQLQATLTLECQRAGLGCMKMKSVSFPGISVLKRVLYYISSRNLPEAVTVRSPGFRWGFVLNSPESAFKEHPVLFLLGCWAWLSKMDAVCALKG